MAVDWGDRIAPLWGEPVRSHAHLRLAAALEPQPRRKAPAGGGRGPVKYEDRGQHARQVKQQLSALRERQAKRTAVFGVHPDLVLVVLFNRGVTGMDDRLEKAGLLFLAAMGQQAIAAFSSDPAMAEFLRHLVNYEQGVPLTGQTAHYEDLFDAIDEVRPLEPGDVIDSEVRTEIAGNRPP
jgi:hypothetical protein